MLVVTKVIKTKFRKPTMKRLSKSSKALVWLESKTENDAFISLNQSYKKPNDKEKYSQMKNPITYFNRN